MQPSPEQKTENNKSRIESHGQGIGVPTPEALERRAREIATIEGRVDGAVTTDDRKRAWRELHDKTLWLASDEARSDIVGSRNPADVPLNTGHEVRNLLPVDEQENPEIEVKEGVREAEHERMLQGQKLEDEKKP